MRGKENPSAGIGASKRITPAHAGKSLETVLHDLTLRDHPRPCGEKISFCVLQPICWGSPPPMRGKALGNYNTRLIYRITPAHAGKSFWRRLCLCITWDHPRPCGEKSPAFLRICVHTGSPPPMRGKDVSVRSLLALLRITPAHAGKRAQICFELRAF